MNKVVVRKMGERECVESWQNSRAIHESHFGVRFERKTEREKEIEEDEQDKNARAFWIATLFLRL